MMTVNSARIETVQNGFIVYEDAGGAVIITHDQVGVAIVINITHCQAATDFRLDKGGASQM